ncbi:VWA domain-containing protein [uncultured Bacteroides sp.]|uniref:VWA domain-containing protein n=1 Tax=uncultured Bacteroides sp. TaxID=162156 RepID=UPI0025F5D03F|nr:VWA domain-containing protein [uncultured Bacteroides sp.]
MNKRTETIRLKYLQDIYYEKLQGIAYGVFDEHLHNRIIRPEELDADIHVYYRHTLPSLQDFYSRYASQWEYFHEMDDASDAKFLQFLRNSAYSFSMKYHLVDLNVKYYLQRFNVLGPRTKEWKALRTLFFDKWHALLSNNEFNYQMEHINQLCEDFYRLQMTLTGNLPVRGNSRLVWLLRNHKQLADQILEYEDTIKRNPVIRKLVELLGKKHQSSRKRFKMTAGIRREQIVSHATRSDITGITEGNDLNSLLPLEYCYLAEKSLQTVFFERFIEKRLQVIDYQSHEKQPIKDKKTTGNETSEEAEGPFIVCLDTSGSMAGERERIAKSVLLAIAELTEIQHRKCYVMLFSDDIECIEIDDLGNSFDRLVDFLCQTFHGGTDIEPVITQALRKIGEEGYVQADIITVSDFEMRPVGELLARSIERAKAKETKMYAISLGGKNAETSYLNLCDKYWEYSVQDAKNLNKDRLEESKT